MRVWVPLCVLLATLALAQAGPCEDCLKDKDKGWCVSLKACVPLKELAAKGSCPMAFGVFVPENCPKAETAVKCDVPTVKKVLGDILKGVSDDTKKLAAADAAAAEKIAAELIKTTSLFYDTTNEEKAVATDLYYCTFGPYAPVELKADVDKARSVVKTLMETVAKKFGKQAAAAQAEAEAAANPLPKKGKMFLELHQRLTHKKSSGDVNPLALIEAQSKARLFDWYYNLYNWGVYYAGWVPYAAGYMQPAHCGYNTNDLFTDCVGPHRAWAQNAANCAVPMRPLAGGVPANSACDWWSGAQNCPLGAVAPPAAPAPAILGPEASIEYNPGNCGAHGHADGVRAGHVNDCRAQGYNRLHLWGRNFDECVNLQWSYCQTVGQLPGQGGVASTRILVPPRRWNVRIRHLHLTQQEMCALHFLCTNNAELWRADAPFLFQCRHL